MVGALPGIDAGPSALPRSSTAEELASVLREEILHGRLAPDEPMREIALAEHYEVSRRTVREALNLLEHAGLVRHHRHKGSRVTRLTAADIHDLYRVRRTLELAAAELCDSAAEARRDVLRLAYRQLAEATATARAEDIVARDLDFHRAVVGLLDSRRVDAFFGAIALEMRYALMILESSYQESKHRPAAALAEHEAICEALLAGDAARATTLVAEHIAVNEALLADAVDARPDEP